MATKASRQAGPTKASKKPGPNEERLIARNRRASFDYELGERFEAGVALVGSEARSLRESSADVSDAWVDVVRGEAWVRGMRVPPLKHACFGHEEKRARKLLLHEAEIERLRIATERDRMTLIVPRIYFKGGRVKIEVAVARGKKNYDKRQAVRERDAANEARAAMQSAAKHGRRG
jgi:SsrA-binding protein